ncbi:MAG: GTPase HflX [Omnitrophica WOR_2 bacterium GWA2_47_8]|nr:MAG: GTPase HflX [Omnitrophica WOR_2 bacterium GWA2_47_8]
MPERVLTVVVDYRPDDDWPLEDVTAELAELVKTSGGEVVTSVPCRIDKPTPTYFIGSGKVDEIALACQEHNIQTVIFSHDLKGSQQRNIEEILKVKTIDRTQLILDIFAKHASSQEGKTQVELAQLQYLLPRLVGQGIELSRLGGGIGTLGPGETKLEVDRRRISDRISRLRKDLKDLETNQNAKRKKRQDQGIPVIALVGYTNAGKSTLLNALTESNQVVADKLFTTLDSLSRQMVLPNNQKVIISDTVGFIHELPPHLIESFKTTLMEVTEADILLHVLDVSHPNFRRLHTAVMNVLAELNVHDKPMITVLNKIDKITDQSWLKDLQGNYESAVYISALKETNIDALTNLLIQTLSPLVVEVDVTIPIKRMDLVNLAHEKGQVLSVKYYNDTIHLRASLPAKVAAQFKSFA